MRQRGEIVVVWLLGLVLVAGAWDNALAMVDIKDNNVWVYADLFVDRFGKPAEFVDKGLQGAEGVAIRLVPLMRDRCHSSGGDEDCVPSWQWLMDIYIDLGQDIGIQGDMPRQFKPWRSSIYFLARHDPSLRARWEKAFGLKGGRMVLVRPDGSRQPLHFEVFSYKRPIKDGLLMVQARISGDSVEADPSLVRVVEFTDPRGRVLHRVRFPASYWRRVAAYRSEHPDVGPVNWEGGLEKDPHIWVYTEEFANKYHLPASGISGEMEGAMAMAFRMDSGGAESCGFFGSPKACMPIYINEWSVYLPPDARLYYTDKTMNNFYSGYSSNIFLHEKQRRRKDKYSMIVSGKGLKCGAHIYRLWKKRTFGFLGKKEKTRWYGGPIWNHSYLQPRALGTDFTFVEHVDTIDELGCDQYFVINSDPNKISLRDLYRSKFHKARIPTPFMRAVQGYISRFTASHRTLLDDFYDVLEGKSVEGRK
ncbi:hypothetical protein ACLG6S_04445 [Thermodesulfobacteriota bacterium B35]